MARLQTTRIVLLTLVLVLVGVLHYTTDFFAPLRNFVILRGARTFAGCSPAAWNAGHWEHHPRRRIKSVNDTDLSRREDIFKYNGLEGCAADREFYWHLGADNNEQLSRHPTVTEWQWIPSAECSSMQPMTTEGLVKHLVEDGGWFLLGDSVTENHFFSLSCSLYPHVRATPNYTENPYFDRAWPQNLYLNPSSPLIKTLNLPDGFSVEETPLVTFRRNDILLTHEQLEVLHRAKYSDEYEAHGAGPAKNFTLFSDEPNWAQTPAEVWAWFTEGAPKRYGTLFTNTAGHWTTHHFLAFQDPHAEGQGIRPLISFFGLAMARWAREMQALIDGERAQEVVRYTERLTAGRAGQRAGGKTLRREVVVRAYSTGHEDCHKFREPWETFQPHQAYANKWFNWAWFEEMNELFERIVSSPLYPDIHFLAIDRPQRLRPDAHGTSDCLHLMTGAGIMEGWTHYLYHFLTRELPQSRK